MWNGGGGETEFFKVFILKYYQNKVRLPQWGIHYSTLCDCLLIIWQLPNKCPSTLIYKIQLQKWCYWHLYWMFAVLHFGFRHRVACSHRAWCEACSFLTHLLVACCIQPATSMACWCCPHCMATFAACASLMFKQCICWQSSWCVLYLYLQEGSQDGSDRDGLSWGSCWSTGGMWKFYSL